MLPWTDLATFVSPLPCGTAPSGSFTLRSTLSHPTNSLSRDNRDAEQSAPSARARHTAWTLGPIKWECWGSRDSGYLFLFSIMYRGYRRQRLHLLSIADEPSNHGRSKRAETRRDAAQPGTRAMARWRCWASTSHDGVGVSPAPFLLDPPWRTKTCRLSACHAAHHPATVYSSGRDGSIQRLGANTLHTGLSLGRQLIYTVAVTTPTPPQNHGSIASSVGDGRPAVSSNGQPGNSPTQNSGHHWMGLVATDDLCRAIRPMYSYRCKMLCNQGKGSEKHAGSFPGKKNAALSPCPCLPANSTARHHQCRRMA